MIWLSPLSRDLTFISFWRFDHNRALLANPDLWVLVKKYAPFWVLSRCSFCSFLSPAESHSISVAFSDDWISTMTPQTECPEQGRFSKDEINFLGTYLSAYEALCHQLAEKATGPNGKESIKGLKKDWVLENVFPTFVKEFSSDQTGGPQLQSLQTVSCLLWHVLVAEGC